MKDKQSLIIGSIAAVVAILIAIILIYNNTTPKVEDLVMENWVGKNIEELSAWADENSIELDLVYEYNDVLEKDIIIEQEVKVDEVINRDEELKFTVSNGINPEEMITLIDFTGKTLFEIQAFVDENLLTDVTYEFVTDEEIEKDVFIKLNTEETTVKRNTLLVFTISSGKEGEATDELIILPDFSAYSKTQITNWGKSNNVTIKELWVTSETIDRYDFVKQSPSSGTEIKSGSTINITYSQGPKIQSKSFVNSSKSDVTAWINEYQNRVKVSYLYSYSDTVAKDIVLSNTPNSGVLQDGATITVILSYGKPTVNSYVGRQESDFNAYITQQNKYDAEFTIKRTEEYSDKDKGVIIKQDVVGETVIGKTINITVSLGKEPIDVVNFTGKPVSELQTWATTNKLLISQKTSYYSDTIAKDSIVEQTPNSSTVAENATITYIRSLGKYTPDASLYASGSSYQNLSSAIASANTLKAGWTVNSTEELHSTITKGNIISCTVTGKVIDCKVSKGISLIVNNYVGSESPLLVNGQHDGLNMIIKYEENHSSVEKNKVVSQSISAGSVVENGSTITLTLSKGPAPTYRIPIFSEVAVNANNFDEGCKNVKSILNNVNYNNVICEVVSGDDNPHGFNGVFKSMNYAMDEVVPLEAQIIVYIYGI